MSAFASFSQAFQSLLNKLVSLVLLGAADGSKPAACWPGSAATVSKHIHITAPELCNFWEMSLSNFILIHFRVWRVVKHMEKNAST